MAYRIEFSYHPAHNPRFTWVEKPESFNPSAWIRGHRADPESVPKKAREYSKFKRFPDVFATLGIWTVSDGFRQIAEELEPGINQFFAVEMFRKDGLQIPKKYFFMNVCQSFDAIDIEQSNVEWYENEYGSRFLTQDRGGFRLVMHGDAIADRHLWCGDRHFFNQTYVSDLFMKKLKAAKLNGWRADKIEEI